MADVQRMQMTAEELALRLLTSGECLMPPEGERLLRELTAKVRTEVLREAADEIAGIDFHPNARASSLELADGLARRLRHMADTAERGERRG